MSLIAVDMAYCQSTALKVDVVLVMIMVCMILIVYVLLL